MFRSIKRYLKTRRQLVKFDEDFYLRQYTDVADAVLRGQYQSGLEHYKRHGHREGRQIFEGSTISLRHGAAFEQTEFATLRAIDRRMRPLRYHITPSRPAVANIFIPTLDKDVFFGGYIAFLNFLMRISLRGMKLRFILLEETSFKPADFDTFRADKLWQGAFDDAEFVNASKRDVFLSLNPSDVFISYSTWTTLDAAPLAERLKKKVIFFIQEYEPSFHCYDSFHFMSNSAYSVPHVAIFNSRALKDYFEVNRIGVFARPDPQFVTFEHAILSPPPPSGRKRTIPALLFYARPEAHALRNLFSVGVLALRTCAGRGIITPRWQLTGIGSTTYYKLEIGRGIYLNGLPKLAPDEYRRKVQDYTVGLSLMATPHPGVVHFEWAAAGLATVVNTTPERAPAFFHARSPNLVPAQPTVAGIADAIEQAAKRTGGLEPPSAAISGYPTSWNQAFDAAFMDQAMKLIARC